MSATNMTMGSQNFSKSTTKFSPGLTLPEEPTYTEEQIRELGLAGIKAKEEAKKHKANFELEHSWYWNIKQDTIGVGGFFKIPKSLAEVKEALANSNDGQLESKKEDCEIEVQNIDEIITILNTSVFSTRVKEDFEKTGVVSVCMTHLGHDSIETLRGQQYMDLVALTNEKIALLTEVRGFFKKCKKLYQEEIAARETRKPGELKTLQKKGKDLTHAGEKVCRELEKVAVKFGHDRTPENRQAFRELWDNYGELAAEHVSIRGQIYSLNPQAQVEEFPEVSNEVRHSYKSIGMLGIV
jgi:hypothetical protein